MEFWLTLGGILLCFLLYPYLRFLIKRLVFVVRIKKICQNSSFVLTPVHKYWFLGFRQKKESCDFVLKRDHEVYAVKMFPLLRHLSALLFNRNREYTVRHFVIFFSKFSSVTFHFDRRPKKLCNYWKDISGENQAIRKILLIHPCGIDVSGVDCLGGIEVLAAQQFLSELDRKK